MNGEHRPDGNLCPPGLVQFSPENHQGNQAADGFSRFCGVHRKSPWFTHEMHLPIGAVHPNGRLKYLSLQLDRIAIRVGLVNARQGCNLFPSLVVTDRVVGYGLDLVDDFENLVP